MKIDIDLDGYEFDRMGISHNGILSVRFRKMFEDEWYTKKCEISLDDMTVGEKTSLFALIKKIMRRYLTDETFKIEEIEKVSEVIKPVAVK